MRNLKKFLAVLVVVAMIATSMMTAFGAADPALTPADKAAGLGLLKGGADGLVNDAYLNLNTQRIQTAIIYLRLLGKEAEARAYTATTDNFADANLVSGDTVNLLAYLRANPQLGWVGDGTNFSPLTDVSGQALYKVMLTAVGYTQGLDFDYGDTIGFARAKGFSLAAYVGYADAVTNNGMAAAMIEALGTTLNGKTITLAQDLVDKKVITADDASKYTSYVAPTATPVPAQGIASVKSDNLILLNVKFNAPVDATKGIDKANYTVKVGNTVKNIKTDGISLSADKMTATILLDGVANQIAQADKVTVTYAKAAAGTTADLTATSDAINDTTIPTIKSVVVTGNKLVAVTYSEPIIDTDATNLGNFKIDGSVLPAQAPALSKNGLVTTLKLSTALSAGVHKVVVSGKDYATLPLVTNSTDITVATDTTAPAKVELVGDAGQSKVVVKFDKAIDSIDSAKVGDLATTDAQPVVDGTDATLVTLNYGAPYLPASTSTIVFTNVKDLYGNVTPSMTLVVTPKLDNVRPTYVGMTQPYDAGVNTKFVVEYSKEVDYTTGTYLLKDKDGNVNSVTPTAWYVDSANNTVKTKVVLTATGVVDDTTKGPWTLKISGVKDNTALANVIVDNTQTLSFVDKTVPAAPSISYTGTKVFIVFNEKMDAASALTAANYTLTTSGGAITQLPSDAIIALSADGKIVTIQFATGTVIPTVAASVNIFGLKDVALNTMVGVSLPMNLGTTAAPTITNAVLTDAHTVKVTIGGGVKLNSNSVQAYDFKVYNGSTLLTTTGASYDAVTNLVTLTISEAITTNATYNGLPLSVYTSDSPVTTDLYGTALTAYKLTTPLVGIPVTDTAKCTATAIAKAYYDSGSDTTIIRVSVDEVTTVASTNVTAGVTPSQFSVNLDGSLRDFNVVSAGKELLFTLTSAQSSFATDVNKNVTITFTPLATPTVVDLSGNALKAFSLSASVTDRP